MTRKDSQGRRLCTAHTKAGKPCRSPALTGATVCRMHGGAAPQVREKAARVVLEELVGPALATLRDLIESDATPAAVKLAAARDILDRTGYKPPAKVEWDGPPPLPVVEGWIDDLLAEERERHERLGLE